MTLTQTLRLTAAQFEILCHRLEVADAIAEAIGADPDPVDEICDALLRDNLEAALHVSRGITHDVLEDAVCGSVVWALTEEKTSYERFGELRLHRVTEAGRALARRVGTYIGRDVEFPEH